MKVLVDIPDSYFEKQSEQQIAAKLKLHTALLLFQTGYFSRGQACEFANIDIYSFLESCHNYHIPVINYTPEELNNEFEQLKKL
jgi:predicted HTH domain antitoxin